MGLIRKLRDDIIDSDKKLSAILRKAKVLASMLKNEELKKWVEYELNGYPSADAVPDYRQSVTQSYGYFVGPLGSTLENAPIPPAILPEPLQKFAKKINHVEGVRGLESLIEGDSRSFKVQWPADVLPLIQDKIYDGYSCIAAWRNVGRGHIEQILDIVRNKLLSFVLELMEKYPEIDDKDNSITNLPKDQVSSVVNTYILGSHNVVASGQYVDQTVIQDIKMNDINSLLDYMRKIGIPDDDVDELKKAVEADGVRKDKNKFGPEVIAWICKMAKKTLEGVWKVGISVASALLTKALATYYGWE